MPASRPGKKPDTTRRLEVLSRAAGAMLQAPDLQGRIGCYLETVRAETGYQRAVLTLCDEAGKEFQWFFAGYSDTEINRFHADEASRGRPETVRNIGPDGEVRCALLRGRGEALLGVLRVDRPAEMGDEAWNDAGVRMFVAQMAQVLEIERLEQAAAETSARHRRLEGQLAQAEKMSAVGQLVSGVAHELSNPLSGVIGFSELLLGAEVAPRTRQHLQRIHEEAIRCRKIVQNLLSFTRRHKPEFSFRGVDEVVDSVLELRSYHLKVDDIEVERRFDRAVPPTRLDFHQMEQVFLNIINNAHQAMIGSPRRPRRLLIEIEREGDRILVRFQDNGPGIPADRLKKIFEPFFTTKGTGQGTGLGLNLSQAIVGHHQGTLTASSRLGEGTTFTVDLPLVEAPETAVPVTAAVARPRAPKRSLHVLVVDDEVVLVDLLTDVLKHAGHTVDRARDGHRALELASSRKYDAILSDLKMPGLDGQGLFERLCAVKPEMKQRFIFSTGDLANPKVQAFFAQSGCRYLIKPFKLESVLAVLDDVAGHDLAA